MAGIPFKEVLESELQEIAESRKVRGQGTLGPHVHKGSMYEKALDSDLIGLSFSGGGIRSATFNLGILQALADLGLLRKFDYLSTVSGGGYIGSWFQAWIQRTSFNDAEHFLKDGRYSRRETPEDWPEDPIQFLRQYSNYLTPKMGILSGDTWAMVSIYLRNLILNQSVLVSLIAVALLLPRLLVFVTRLLDASFTQSIGGRIVQVPELLGASVAIGMLLVAVYSIGQNLRSFSSNKGASDAAVIMKVIVAPLVAASWLGSGALWAYAEGLTNTDFGVTLRAWSIPAVVISVLLAILSWSSNFWEDPAKKLSRFTTFRIIILSSILPGLAAGFFLALLIKLFNIWNGDSSGYWHAITWGTPLMMLAFSLTAVLHIGLLGAAFPDDRREWWSRLGGLILIGAILWTIVFVVAVYSPLLLAWSMRLTMGLGAGWIASTIWGVVAGKSAKTTLNDGNGTLQLVTKVAPYIFAAGLLVLISAGLHFLLAYLAALPEFTAAGRAFFSNTYGSEQHWSLAELPFLLVFGSWILLGAFAALMAFHVDINEFSMHHFYRNRLVRCYLGASRKRKPQPFTAFDREDDVALSRLRTKNGSTGPYPIINVALNLVGGKQLAWQQRLASSFVFTSKYSGYELAGEGDERICAYRHTEEYSGSGGVSLGTAFAISGAAASPNMGYHSSLAVGFLMTMFNVRMGWWLGNPARDQFFTRKSPRVAIECLVKELLGQTDENFKYVYLSDGGHFENLGVYELVRRRCRFIVACDGSQDGRLQFDDLGNLIRKCRTDFGIDIDIDLDSIRMPKDAPRSLWHCAIGTIRYDRVHPGAPLGIIVYLKASLTGDEHADVLNYASGKSAFPHESTADQWFDEAQFESYRTLGHHVAMKTFKATVDDTSVRKDSADFFEALRQAWYPHSPAIRDSFSKHGAAIDEVYSRLREDENLKFLDQQFYLHWRELAKHTEPHSAQSLCWLPTDPKQVRSGFYFCSSLIQLMENVYVDLDLTQNYDHPDNRGWMNLFKHWAWAGMFRVTWAITASTFGARFQTFCRQQLGLNYENQIHISTATSSDSALNFHESRMIRIFEHESEVIPDLYLLQMKVDDLVSDEANRMSLRFTFGFALVHERKVLAFRIQDHLRRMGLGRRALAALVDLAQIEDFDPIPLQRFKKDASPDAPDREARAEWRYMAAEENAKKFTRLLELAKRRG